MVLRIPGVEPIGYEGLDGSAFSRGGVLSHYQESIQAFAMDDLTSSGYSPFYFSARTTGTISRNHSTITNRFLSSSSIIPLTKVPVRQKSLHRYRPTFRTLFLHIRFWLSSYYHDKRTCPDIDDSYWHQLWGPFFFTVMTILDEHFSDGGKFAF